MDADDRFEEVLNEIKGEARLRFCSFSHSSSQIVGAQALFNVLDNERYNIKILKL